MSWGFFSRIFGRTADDARSTSVEETEAGDPEKREEGQQSSYGFNVERAARIIDHLPSDVSRESAVHIVRGTLEAAGIKVEDLERSTRARETKLDSEIELARSRQNDLRERTEDVVRSLQEEMRKVREACDIGIAEEEEKVSRAIGGLKEMKRVRAFFGFPETEVEKGGADPAAAPTGDETQDLGALDPDKTQVMRRPPDSLADPSER
jgi:hypothetical protein